MSRQTIVANIIFIRKVNGIGRRFIAFRMPILHALRIDPVRQHGCFPFMIGDISPDGKKGAMRNRSQNAPRIGLDSRSLAPCRTVAARFICTVIIGWYR
jgi:hypothetical protein